MLKAEVLAKLSQLNLRTPLAAPIRRTNSAQQDSNAGDDHDDLSKLPNGIEVVNQSGKHWLREQTIDELWSNSSRSLSATLEPSSNPAVRSDNRPTNELLALRNALPTGAAYLDLETCGFAGSMVFLIGLIEWQEGSFRLAQLLARHYGEEKAIFQTLWNRLAGKSVLVTFNGKSFDWPMVLDRSTLHRLENDGFSPADGSEHSEPPLSSKFIQCDLLHHARRRWKNQLPDCKLQTLERFVCRRRRADDIPGRDIPAAYHDFVRTNDAWLIRSVLHHNALDLVTLLQLSLTMCRNTE